MIGVIEIAIGIAAVDVSPVLTPNGLWTENGQTQEADPDFDPEKRRADTARLFLVWQNFSVSIQKW